MPFVLMGLGIALVMSPMSTAAMNAVSVQKSGVASGVLQMSRMVGASVGVAATGAIFQSQLGSSFDPAQLATAPRAGAGDLRRRPQQRDAAGRGSSWSPGWSSR